MKNILFVKGSSQYDAARHYIDEISKAFPALGFNVIVLDSNHSSIHEQLEEVSSIHHWDVIFTINAIEIPFFSQYADIYCTYVCDHPSGNYNRYKQATDSCLFIQCDGYQKEYNDTYYPNIGRTEFVPLSGNFDSTYIPYTDRQYDIVFTGTYTLPHTIYDSLLANHSNSTTIIQQAINLIVSNPSLSLEETLHTILSNYGIAQSTEEFSRLMYQLYDINSYVRAYYRDKLLRTLLQAGLRIDVFGNGWETLQQEFPDNLILHGNDSTLALKAVANAKLSLNIMPWFKDGFQERIATAMLSGTVAITDTSKYIDENFTDSENIILYSLSDLEALVPRIHKLLSEPVYAEQIANNGKETALKFHTWQHRAAEIAAYIKDFTHDVSSIETGTMLHMPFYENQRRLSYALDYADDLNEILDTIRTLKESGTMTFSDYCSLLRNVVNIVASLQQEFTDFPILLDSLNTLSSIQQQDYTTETIVHLELYIEHLLFYIEKLENTYLKNNNDSLITELSATNTQYTDLILQRILQRYEDSTDPSIVEILDMIKATGCIAPYYGSFTQNYLRKPLENFGPIYLDAELQLYYVNHHGHKLFYPQSFTPDVILSSYRFIEMEQDPQSPHVYEDDSFHVCENDIVIDAGVAEGNFSLSIIDKVSKLYLVECDPTWISVLEHTFEPYKDKVTIIPKMLCDYDDDEHITIDTIANGQTINFIKMDIEGAELSALAGAKNTLSQSEPIQCAICSYHRRNDETNIKTILQSYDFKTSTTDGFMFFKEDNDSLIDGELRRGIVRGTKNIS